MDKPIWVFSGAEYYPRGGLLDCVGRFNTLEEARVEFRKLISSDTADSGWWQIVDIRTSTILDRKGWEHETFPEFTVPYGNVAAGLGEI